MNDISPSGPLICSCSSSDLEHPNAIPITRIRERQLIRNHFIIYHNYITDCKLGFFFLMCKCFSEMAGKVAIVWGKETIISYL